MASTKIDNPFSVENFFARQAGNRLRETIEDAKSDGYLSENEKAKIANDHLVATLALGIANEDSSLPAEVSPLFSFDRSYPNLVELDMNLHSAIPPGHISRVRPGFELNALDAIAELNANPAVNLDLDEALLALIESGMIPATPEALIAFIEAELAGTVGSVNLDGTGPLCFVAGTPIQLASGETVPIEEIADGQAAMGFDFTKAMGRAPLEPCRVVRVYTNVTQELVRLDFEDDRDPLYVTPGHAFLDVTGAFTRISDLSRLGGGNVRLIDETGRVVAATATLLRYSEKTADMFERAEMRSTTANGNTLVKTDVVEGWKTYNFESEGLHTYVAGGIRVHNQSGHFDFIDGSYYYDDHTTPGHDLIDVEFYNTHFNTDKHDPVGTIKVPEGGGFRYVYEPGHQHEGRDWQPGGDFDNDGDIDNEDRRQYNVDLHQRHAEIARRDGDDGKADAHERAAQRAAEHESGNTSGKSPAIIDLDGDGVEISVNGNVSFDMDGDGFLENTSWAYSDDGFLVIDLNEDGSRGEGDGVIDQTKELILSEWAGWFGATDIQALATFDKWASRGGNNGGVLDHRDGVWDELKIWQDVNQNGVSEQGELFTLAELGITEINLTYDDGTHWFDGSNDVTVFGNSLLGSVSITRNGQVQEGALGDVLLTYSVNGWREVETANGYQIEFENGPAMSHIELDGTGPADINLVSSVLDGAVGDARSNDLDGIGATWDLVLSGGDGNDELVGGSANDLISGDAGADVLRGSHGNDIIFFDAADTYVEGGSGYDVAIATGSTGVSLDLAARHFEAAHGTDANDTLDGGLGGSEQAVEIDGKGGNDRFDGSNAGDLLQGGRAQIPSLRATGTIMLTAAMARTVCWANPVTTSCSAATAQTRSAVRAVTTISMAGPVTM